MISISSNKSSKLFGNVIVPGDKSISHRALILGSLVSGKIKIKNLLESDDVIATLEALKTLGIKINKNDDYLAMKEVLSRRFKRLQKDGNNFPDLVVIDGGKGQLSSAIKEIEKYEGCNTKILSLVKGPDRNSKYDDVLYFYDGKIIRMDLEQEGKRLLQFVRDESHRFALSRSKKRRKNLTKSTLDEIKGIGSKNKKVLLRHFGGLESLRKASIDQIKSIEGIGSIRAKLIYDYLNEK